MEEYQDAKRGKGVYLTIAGAVVLLLSLWGADQCGRQEKAAVEHARAVKYERVIKQKKQECLAGSHKGIMEKIDQLWTFWQNKIYSGEESEDSFYLTENSFYLVVDDKELEETKRSLRAGTLTPIPPSKGYFFFSKDSKGLTIAYHPPFGSGEKPFMAIDFDGDGIKRDRLNTTADWRNIEARLNTAYGNEDEYNKREDEILGMTLAILERRHGTGLFTPPQQFERCIFY